MERAWDEGFRSTEILKRYTTATMGPCQGMLCHCHLRSFVAARSGATGPASGPTTARPPTRGLTLEEAAAGVCDDIQLHQRTALDGRHLELGVTMEPTAPWRRPRHYGDPAAEYWAVRHGVSVMDVGTLGKFLVGGREATAFLEKLYPCNVADIAPGRIRYALLLGEHGFVIDDGIICSLDGGRWYVTFTSAGATTVEATLKDWADAWRHDVHIVDLTAGWGAINVAGPHRANSSEAERRRTRQRHLPVSAPSRDHGRGRRVPGGPRRLRGALSTSFTTRVTGASSSGTLCWTRAAILTYVRMASTHSACYVSRRVTSSSARTPILTPRPGG